MTMELWQQLEEKLGSDIDAACGQLRRKNLKT